MTSIVLICSIQSPAALGYLGGLELPGVLQGSGWHTWAGRCTSGHPESAQEFVVGRGTAPTTIHAPRILQGMWLLEVGDNATVAESQVWSGCKGGDSVPERTLRFYFLSPSMQLKARPWPFLVSVSPSVKWRLNLLQRYNGR